MEFMFLVLLSFLHITSQNPTNYWTLVPNVLVLEVNGEIGQHPLSCLHSVSDNMRREDKDQDIFWKKDGIKVESSKGNVHLVELQESSGGGNYSCYSKDGSLLNHTVVLIHEDETKRKKILEKVDQEFLKCSAVNYKGEFHCSWKWHPSRNGKVAFVKVQRTSNNSDMHCTVDVSARQWTCLSGQHNMSCSVDDSGHGISCLDAQHCPYAEETHYIHITVYVSIDFLVENYSKHFYLSEIVKPDKVQISKINKTAIEWTYPSSWASPYSYFPLTFQIGQIRRHAAACNRIRPQKITTVNCTDKCCSKIQHHTKTVCVRAKDALSNSKWSEWSPFMLKQKKIRRTRCL